MIMKKSLKSFIAAAVAGCMTISSTVGVFAANRYEYGKDNEYHVITGFIRDMGGSTTGFNISSNPLLSQNVPAGMKLANEGNFIRMTVMDMEDYAEYGNGGANGKASVGDTATGEVAYCVEPDKPIPVSMYWQVANNYNNPASELGYMARVMPFTESAAYKNYGLDTEQLNNLRYAISAGSNGTVEMEWGPNAFHGNVNEWVETNLPGKVQGYSSTIGRVATQIMVWTILYDWYGNEQLEREALKCYTVNFSDSEKAQISSCYYKIKNEMADIKNKTSWVEEISPNGSYNENKFYTRTFTETSMDSGIYVYNLTFKDELLSNVPASGRDVFANEFVNAIINSSEGQLKKQTVSITKHSEAEKIYKDEKYGRTEIDSNTILVTRYKSGYRIYMTDAAIGDMAYEKLDDGTVESSGKEMQVNIENVVMAINPNVKSYKDFVYLTNATVQDCIVPRPFPWVFKIVKKEKTPPDLTQFYKTFNGAQLESENADEMYAQCKFAVVDTSLTPPEYVEVEEVTLGDEYEEAGLKGKKGYSFVKNGSNYVTHMDYEDAGLISLTEDGYCYFTEEIDFERFDIVEVSAPTGYDEKVGLDAAMLLDEETGEYYFDNTGDGIAVLYMNKVFTYLNGAQLTGTESDEDLRKMYQDALDQTAFTVTDAEGNLVAATGENGMYDAKDGGTTTFKLGADRTLFIDNLKPGVYTIKEVSTSDAYDWQKYGMDLPTLIEAQAVPIEDADMDTAAERKQYASTHAASKENSIRNVYRFTEIQINKTTDDNRIDKSGFYFNLYKIVDGKEVIVSVDSDELRQTDASGKLVFKNLPVYDENGKKIEYVIREDVTSNK